MASDRIELADVKQGETVDTQPMRSIAKDNPAEGNPKKMELADVKQGETVEIQPMRSNARDYPGEGNPKKTELADGKQGETEDLQPMLNNARDNLVEGNTKITTLTYKNELKTECEIEKSDKEEVDASKVKKDDEDGPKKSEVQSRPDATDKYPEQNSSGAEGDSGRRTVGAAVVDIEKVPDSKGENSGKLPENVTVAPPKEEEDDCLLDALSFLMGLCNCTIL